MKARLWFVSIVVSASGLMADTINPSTYTATLAVGETATIHKTVTVTQQSTALVDVFFLTDTTGSMGSAIASVRDGFGSIVSSLSPLASNVAYGVGEYKDVVDSFAYRRDQNLTTNTGTVQSALNGLSAGGGGDFPEANIFGLNQAATTTAWRSGSQRFLVWVGDAPGHDPSSGVTEAAARGALIAANLKVFSVNLGGLDNTGQATRITAATGGQLLSGGYTEAANIIRLALTRSILNYSLVNLGVTAPAGVGISFTPASGYSGTFDRSANRTFDFDVTFTGVAPGTYSFGLDALVDGNIVATETDRIVVGDGGSVPEPSTLVLMFGGLAAIVTGRRLRASR